MATVNRMPSIGVSYRKCRSCGFEPDPRVNAKANEGQDRRGMYRRFVGLAGRPARSGRAIQPEEAIARVIEAVERVRRLNDSFGWRGRYEGVIWGGREKLGR